jgi:hypothetical protein
MAKGESHTWARSSPHPFIAGIPLAFSLLLPLLIALLLFLLLGTAPSAVFEFFLIHLTLVWRGLVDVWSSVAGCRGRIDRGRRGHCRRDD